jgi:hypothetical protein
MEAPRRDGKTDFAQPDAFARDDETPDAGFYAVPRRVLHIDGTSARQRRELYERIIRPGSETFDLMAGWVSHPPVDTATPSAWV